ncbi:MAG: hypothetical protein N4A62_10550 [Marinisporobacter sp.]|nr:hypothetical protein [Marinisporobacter sp.]
MLSFNKIFKKIIIVLCIFIITFGGISGCGKNTNEVNVETTKKEINENAQIDYSKYLGSWMVEDEDTKLVSSLVGIFGGTTLEIEEIKDGKIKGALYTIQGSPSNRTADISFEASIEDKVFETDFIDTWENEGNAKFILKDEEIVAQIEMTKPSEIAMWGIQQGELVFKKEKNTQVLDLKEDEKEYMEIYISNYINAGVKPFEEGNISDEELIGFGLRYQYLNNYESFKTTEDMMYIIIPKESVQMAVDNFFGQEIKNHKSIRENNIIYDNENYKLPLADGMAPYGKIEKIIECPENIYYVQMTLNYPNFETGEDEIDSMLLIKLKKIEEDGGHYLLKEYKEIAKF